MGQNQLLEFGKMPFRDGENGGIRGHVVYASTRPFDDPALLLQLTWEPQVPNVTINLYQEGTAPDGSRSLTMVDNQDHQLGCVGAGFPLRRHSEYELPGPGPQRHIPVHAHKPAVLS
jgi:hypothetical protein